MANTAIAIALLGLLWPVMALAHCVLFMRTSVFAVFEQLLKSLPDEQYVNWQTGSTTQQFVDFCSSKTMF